jgi:hypothetical protein
MNAIGWTVGIVAFVVTVAAGTDLYLRNELASSPARDRRRDDGDLLAHPAAQGHGGRSNSSSKSSSSRRSRSDRIPWGAAGRNPESDPDPSGRPALLRLARPKQWTKKRARDRAPGAAGVLW